LEDVPVIRIQPSRGWTIVDLRELWQHRNLLFYLVWRDIRVAYSNTALGIVWVVLQPLATVLVITIIFGMFARIPSDNLPYAVLALSGLVLYSYFSLTVAQAAQSMLSNAYLLTKVYFPRLIIPTVPILTGLVDFVVLLLVLFVVVLLYGISPTLAWLFLPIPILLNITLALGVGLWVSALNIQMRDLGKFVPVLLQIGIYASPVFYPSSLVPEQLRILYSLNPLVGIIDGFRWSLFGVGTFPSTSLMISALAVFFLVISGAFVFRKIEDTAADVI
jgi:lipopolysaccharide transport system permease protein